ncbi:Thiol oxidase [Purpureocillium takamizusanense]|uniref:Sulfhydryl oxidase n=1 Tax=Purpureocillium takamizusanense TaxID=2060973 RepID=A0A9Q8QCY6_9HYPO|nr:Thiol oxidase [Purpureocillium takamizusanense]UNI17355.1 Thiol oxidase [Purpureocillium takamizusanense]
MADDTKEADAPTAAAGLAAEQSRKYAPGVVLGKDGKPCRSCTSFTAWTAQAKAWAKHDENSSSSGGSNTAAATAPTTRPARPTAAGAGAGSAASAPSGPPADCPPDVEVLGRSSWTLLHSIAATYPERPSRGQQSDLLSFVKLFSKLYPCWVCAEDFQTYMGREAPRVGSRGEFGMWLCGAHNEVNRKLSKPEFDCSKWEERWRTGWKDGSCD